MKNHTKTNLLIALALFFTSSTFAQNQIKLILRDSLSNEELVGASVTNLNNFLSYSSNNKGEVNIKLSKNDSVFLKIKYLGYQEKKIVLNGAIESTEIISLVKKVNLSDEIIINATRATRNSATTFSTLTAKEIEKINLGRDIPMLLNQIPSAVVNSDAGAGVGYTGIRIRGTDPTRINTTINGIPINDSESQATFFVNMPDVISSATDVQIQRGVGTSTNGGAAFGASINMQTTQYNPEPYAEANVSGGSFGTLKTNLKMGSGLIAKHFTVDARASRIISDGFIDRATSNLNSYYVGLNYYGKNKSLKLVHFAGSEITYQAWNGIPESRLRNDTQGMKDFAARNFLNFTDSSNLLNSNSRTYNSFTYKNQVDNYKQQHYQAHYSQQFSKYLNANVSLHYTKGSGYYEEFKYDQELASYLVSPVINGTDTGFYSNLIRRKWLDNDFYGTTFSLQYNDNKRINSVFGGGINQYYGNHFGRVVSTELQENINDSKNYYSNNSLKNDYNVFFKNTYFITQKVNVFLDVQFRGIDYTFVGLTQSFSSEIEKASFRFFNPKFGFNYQINQNQNIYSSLAIANREPTREDFVNTTTLSRPKQERLDDIEIGYNIRQEKFLFNAVVFLMEYKNQMVLTGKLNDVGAYTRINVPYSYRRGIELEGAYQINKKFTLRGNIAFSKNEITNYTEFIDNYDLGVQDEIKIGKTNIAFSPEVVGSGTIEIRPLSWIELFWSHKYVGKQFLDNSSSDDRKLNAFYFSDFNFVIQPKQKLFKSISVIGGVYNLFNAKYEPNGFTYGYISGGQRTTENFYYPQAGVNFLVGLSLKIK
jgi:iron complex outermembrane receptor protein